MVRRIPFLTVLLVLLAVLLLFLIPVKARADVTVQAGDFWFSPAEVTISTGETVTWVIVKGFHTSTNGTGEADPNAGTLWDALVFSGQDAQYTFTTPGVYPYFCRFHETLNMFGTITVLGATNTENVTWGEVKSLFR